MSRWTALGTQGRLQSDEAGIFCLFSTERVKRVSLEFLKVDEMQRGKYKCAKF